MIKILAFSGSGRKASFNNAILKSAVQGAMEAGADVTVVNLTDFNMPFFNEDEEAENGIPEGAMRFKKLMIEHDGFLIASPEYNSSYSALLKNSIDWASRRSEGEKPLEAYKGKVAGIIAASDGALGGIRGLVSLRMLLGNLGTMVLPGQKAVGKVSSLLDSDGQLVDEKTQQELKNIGKELVNIVTKLKV